MNRDEQLAAFNQHATNAYRLVLDYLLMNHDDIIGDAAYRLHVGVDEFPDAPMFEPWFEHYENLREELADAVNYMVGYLYAYGAAQKGISANASDVSAGSAPPSSM